MEGMEVGVAAGALKVAVAVAVAVARVVGGRLGRWAAVGAARGGRPWAARSSRHPWDYVEDRRTRRRNLTFSKINLLG